MNIIRNDMCKCLTKKEQLKVVMLTHGIDSFTQLARLAGVSRVALYSAMENNALRSGKCLAGVPLLIKLGRVLDQSTQTMIKWFNGELKQWEYPERS